MTELLERAIAEAGRLSDEKQDTFGEMLLSEIESDQKWDRVFNGSQVALGSLADEALGEYAAGETEAMEVSGAISNH